MRLKVISLAIVAIVASFIAIASIKAQAFEVLEDACKRAPESLVCAESKKTQEPGNNSIYGPNGLFTKAASVISILVGIASVIMIIVGGFRYVMSSGDSSNIKAAKDTILYAIIGLGVSLFAQAIIIFVVKKL